jgi:hypothetical protein
VPQAGEQPGLISSKKHAVINFPFEIKSLVNTMFLAVKKTDSM